MPGGKGEEIGTLIGKMNDGQDLDFYSGGFCEEVTDTRHDL